MRIDTIQFIGRIVYVINSLHCKNTWVTSTTLLGCLSVTKECYQIGFLELEFIEELLL